MKFLEAVKKLDELSPDDHHSIEYRRDVHPNIIEVDGESPIEIECYLYIKDVGSATAGTWEDAFTILDRKINEGDKINLEEAPE